MLFQHFVKKYMVNYDVLITNILEAIQKLNTGLYDIIAFSETLILYPNERYQLFTYDYISDFEDTSDVFFIVDNIEYELKYNTVLFLSLTLLKPIFLIYKGTENKKNIKYNRHCIKPSVLDELNTKMIICDSIQYFFGEIHVDKHIDLEYDNKKKFIISIEQGSLNIYNKQ
jgi:hypothetical protein